MTVSIYGMNSRITKQAVLFGIREVSMVEAHSAMFWGYFLSNYREMKCRTMSHAVGRRPITA